MTLKRRSPTLSRRDFAASLPVIVGALALVGGESGAVAKVQSRSAELKSSLQRPVPAGAVAPNVFVQVAPSGEVTLVCHRSEMGQGVRSSLPVLMAEELGADMARVVILQADGDTAYGDQNTDGSSSVRGKYDQIRRVAAVARELLVQAAAKKWRVKPKDCVATEHQVRHKPTGRALGFGELSALAAKLPVPAAESVRLRPVEELVRVGGDLPLLDAPAYVTGRAQYGADVRVEGMLIAAIERPPVVGGRVLSFDREAALRVPGVRHVVQMPEPQKPYIFQSWGGVAVLADHTWAALKGRAALNVQWEHGDNRSYNSEPFREQLVESARNPGTVLRKVGDAPAALEKAHQRLVAEYHVPHLPHAPMEPPVALADVRDDGFVEVWASTQNPQAARKEAARALGIAEDKIVVHVTFLGGGFGRKSKADYVSEAVLLSREVKAPVRVQWTRADDLQHDYYNTVSQQRLEVGLDASGKAIAWHHRSAFPPIGALFGGDACPSAGDFQQGVLDLALDVPNIQAEGCEGGSHVRIGWLRSVYNIFHGFANSCFMDEIAHLRGKDPRDVMLELIGPPRTLSTNESLGVKELRNYGASLSDYPVDAGRLRTVIERVTEHSGWKDKRAAGKALGLAAHRSFLSYVAVVVSMVERPGGKLCVEEAWVSMDAGRIVNRDRVVSQVEGSVIFGMSLAFHGAITMKDGAVEQSNFRDFRLLRIGDAPRAIHVDVVPSTELSGGVGEPGVPPVAPAIANAVFALTGKRIRRLPLSRELSV